MSKCYYNGISNRGNQKWGRWIMNGIDSIEDNIVQYCRKAFNKEYRDMWIDPIYFDDKYFRFTKDFFSEVGVYLYPKITNIRKELKRSGISVPKPLRKCKNRAEREKVREEWNEYRSIIWKIIHDDIDKNIQKGIKPINIVITGVRYSTKDEKFHEEIKSIKEVQNLDE